VTLLDGGRRATRRTGRPTAPGAARRAAGNPSPAALRTAASTAALHAGRRPSGSSSRRDPPGVPASR